MEATVALHRARLGSTYHCQPGRLAVVLGGGANLGAYQVGVVDALARANVKPALLIGTSIGALNAAFWACSPTLDVGERLLRVWKTASPGKILPRYAWWVRLLRRSDHLFDAAGLRSLITSWLSAAQRIEETAIPLAIVTTDFESGEPVVLRDGSLLEALLASTAIPGFFHPVEVGGRPLVDGGVVANADLEAAVTAGATDALVVDVMGETPPSQSMDLWQAFDRALVFASRRQTDLMLAAERRRIRVSLLRPRLPWLPWMGDLSHTDELFEMGRKDAEALIKEGGGG